MKLIRTILNRQPQVASILLTVILLLWVTGGMAIQYVSDWNAGDDVRVASEQTVPVEDTEHSASPTLSSFNEAVIPIVKIQVLFFCNFFQELDLTEEDNTITTSDTPLPPSRFFLTLFRQIISPNAP